MKHTTHPLTFVLNLTLTTYKECILQLNFDHKLRQRALWPIIFWYSNLFFQTLTTNIFFHSNYLVILMVASEGALRVLSEKHNLERGYTRRNLKINVKNKR